MKVTSVKYVLNMIVPVHLEPIPVLDKVIKNSTCVKVDKSSGPTIYLSRSRSSPKLIYSSRIRNSNYASTKLKLYNVCILPIMLYGSECWALSKPTSERLMLWISGA